MSTEKKKRIVWPRRLFLAFKALAQKYKGVGGGAYTNGRGHPVCYVGYTWQLENAGVELPVIDGLRGGVSIEANDNAVRQVNKRRKGRHRSARAPFELWRKELGIVCGRGNAKA